MSDQFSIVMCMDMKGSVEWSSSETTYKWLAFRSGFHALVSGPTSTAKELSRHCGVALDSECPNSVSAVVATLRNGIRHYKRAFADSHIGICLGVTYEEFRRTGRQEFPEATCREVSSEIKNHRSGTDVIIAGFLPSVERHRELRAKNPGNMLARTPHIFKISNDAVTVCEDFAAIGSGAWLAEASLMQRSQNSHESLASTIYHLYEAKRLSEKADGVGLITRLVTVDHCDEVREMHGGGIAVLEEHFRKLGAQPVAGVSVSNELFVKITPSPRLELS